MKTLKCPKCGNEYVSVYGEAVYHAYSDYEKLEIADAEQIYEGPFPFGSIFDASCVECGTDFVWVAGEGSSIPPKAEDCFSEEALKALLDEVEDIQKKLKGPGALDAAERNGLEKLRTSLCLALRASAAKRQKEESP